MPVSNAQFTVVYDGEALRGNQMDVRDLAPALLALGDVLQQANHVLNGNRATVSVNVKAFKTGCFGISFELAQSCFDSVKGLFSSGSSVRETLEILNLLGFTAKDVVVGSGLGLYWLIKKSRGKKPKQVKQLENGNVCITFEEDDGKLEEVTVDKDVAALFADVEMREAVDKSLEPLRNEGVESFGVEQDGKRNILVTSSEVHYFRLPSIEPTEIPIDETPRECVLAIVSLSFKEDNKWRLSDGSAVFSVKINDRNFLRLVNDGAAFAKGDMLKVLLITTASYSKDGLKTEYTVVKVLEHVKLPRQLWLPDA